MKTACPAPRCRRCSNSKRGGQRPEIKQLRVLGNQRLTSGGQIKRKAQAEVHQKRQSRLTHAGTRTSWSRAPHHLHEVGRNTPEYVNRLRRAMVRRHLSGDFRFVCLTDDASGIRSEVECKPIPPLDLPPAFQSGAAPSCHLQRRPYGLRGTALFLDVDVVVTEAWMTFFTQPGEFLIIHDYKRPWRITGNSSVYRFELGAHPDVLEYFAATLPKFARSSAMSRPTCRTFAQARQVAVLVRESWCPSFKYHGIPAWPTIIGRRRLCHRMRAS